MPGLPVLTLDEGAQLGKVKRVIVDPRQKRVAAFIVSQRGWNQQSLLPMSGVYALGSHAVTVDRGDLLIPIREAVEFQELLKGDRVRIVGAPVVTTGGELVGIVRDFEISGSGAVESLFLAKGVLGSVLRRPPIIQGEHVVALGRDAVLVADNVIDMLSRDDGRSGEERSEAEPRRFRLFSLPKEDDSAQSDKE